MKKVLAYFFFLIPFVGHGQLFPEIPPLQGKVKKIVEKKFGKEVSSKNFVEGVFRPRTASGWNYTYYYDRHLNLEKRIATFMGQLNSEYDYKRDILDRRTIIREMIAASLSGNTGDYGEYENFCDDEGKRIKVNYWAFNSAKNGWEIFQVEQDSKYIDGLLSSFTRYQTNESGDFSHGEKFSLKYSDSGKVERIERLDMVSGFKTVFQYNYNSRGLVERATIDFLTDIQEYKKIQLQQLSYKYDRRGNWTKKYLTSGDQTILEAKRKIKYY